MRKLMDTWSKQISKFKMGINIQKAKVTITNNNEQENKII